MAEYYLISQLPSLDGIEGSAPLPITEERFLELCDRFAGKKVRRELEHLTLVPSPEPQKTGFALIEAWNHGERSLRLALAKARAEQWKQPFEIKKDTLPMEWIKVANAAVELENPLEAEVFLLKHRLQFLETLRPMDAFSEEYLFYYGLKLKLLLRVRQFDTQRGKDEYRKLYNSILNGDRLEA